MTVPYTEPLNSQLTDAKETWDIAMLASPRPMSRWVLWATALGITVLYALLWSPHYYPLSDSSLYLKIAKGIAEGRGFEYIHQTHRSIRPMTPVLLWALIRAGGRIGAMHVVMIVMMLASLGLMFLTLRRWLNERAAFCLTLLTAMSWWFFSNATTIMTEPTFMVFFWAALLVLSYVKDASGSRRTWLVIAGAALVGGAWLNRVAAIVFVPGIVLGLWLTSWRVSTWRDRIAWGTIFAVLVSLMVLDYFRPVKPLPNGQSSNDGGLIDPKDQDSATPGEEPGYRWTLLIGVSNPIIQIPVSGGRWVLETLAAAFVYPYKAKSGVLPLIGTLVGLLTIAILIVGVVRLARSGIWWPVALMTYFLPLWLMWGMRVKGRYMVPIAPILFLALWAGASVLGGAIARKRSTNQSPKRSIGYAWGARIGLAVMLFSSLILNGAAYGLEFSVRRTNPYGFYDRARSGAFAELVDICGYLRTHAPPDAYIWVNRGRSRRVISLLSEHDVVTLKPEIAVPRPGPDAPHFQKMLSRVKGKYLIVYYEKKGWPPFHWPIATPPPPGSPPQWWQLFIYDDASKTFQPVAVPRDRDYMRDRLVYDPHRQ